jgi:hypothetical protein
MSALRSCLMLAIVDRASGNFIHDNEQKPRLYYEKAYAERECVRLRRAQLGTLEVIKCRLVEDDGTLTKSLDEDR